MKAENECKTLQPQSIIDQYADQMLLTEKDKMALHRLFSPYVPPAGLTHEQVRLCIKLDCLRDDLREIDLNYFAISLSDLSASRSLVEGSANETVFKEAVYNFMLLWANK